MTVCNKCRTPLPAPDINLILDQTPDDRDVNAGFEVIAELCDNCYAALRIWLDKKDKS